MRFSSYFVLTGLLAPAAALGATEGQEPRVSCAPERPHVRVGFVGEWTDEVKAAALSDLGAALAPQQMGVCQDDSGPRGDKSVSLVQVELREGQKVRIEVDDSLTNKTVARAIVLEDARESSSALIVAVAIDELLRATWAELSIKKEGPSESDKTPQEEPATQPPPDPVPPERFSRFPSHRVALAGALDAYVEGSVLFGANVVYGSHIGDLVEWSAFAGPRVVRAANASNLGQVRADALAFGLQLDFPVIVTERFFFGPHLSTAATHAWFRGRAAEGEGDLVGEREFKGWALTGRAGLGARLHLGAAFVSAQTRVGVPIVALEVTDGSRVIGGLTGLEWSNGLSLGWWWR